MRTPDEESRHHKTLQGGGHCDGVNHSRGGDKHGVDERTAQQKVLPGNVNGSGVQHDAAGEMNHALGGHDRSAVVGMAPAAAAGGMNQALGGHAQGVDHFMPPREVVEIENVDLSEAAREKAAANRKASVHQRKLEVHFCEIVFVSLWRNCP